MTTIILTRFGLCIIGAALYYHYSMDTRQFKRTATESDVVFIIGLIVYCVAPVL